MGVSSVVDNPDKLCTYTVLAGTVPVTSQFEGISAGFKDGFRDYMISYLWYCMKNSK